MKSSTEVIDYAVELIDPSPYQARKTFREVGLAELGESMRQHGVIQPLVGRLSPVTPGRLELVAGERRLRGAKLAGLEAVPVIIRVLSDQQAEEMMLIENLQREDLSVLEEADGYHRMLQLKDAQGRAIYTVDAIAAKLNKPMRHVRNRLKVRRCPEAVLQAVESGEMAVSVAMLIGRLPDPKARVEVGKKVLKPEVQQVPLNYRQTEELIRTEFLMKIDKTDFDAADPNLVPYKVDDEMERCFGGACTDCPFRSANMDDVETGQSAPGVRGGKSGVDPNVCTMPSCYRAKMDVAWKAQKALIAKTGTRVIDGEEAKKVFRAYGGKITYGSPFAEVSDKPGYEDIGNAAYNLSGSWKTHLKGAEVPVIIARHPLSGKRVELIERKAAAAVVKAKLKGKVDPVADEETAKEAERIKAERAKELLKSKIERKTTSDGVKAIVDAVHSKGVDADGLAYMFKLALERSGSDGMMWFGQWLEIKLPKGLNNSGRSYEGQIIEHVTQRAETPAAWHAFIFVALMSHGLKWGHENELKAMAKRYDVDLKAIEKRCADELKPKKKEVKAKPVKASTDKVDWSTEQVADVTAAADKAEKKRTKAKANPPAKVVSVEEFAEEIGLNRVAPDLLEKARAWKKKNPTKGAGAMADELGLPVELALAALDLLIDEKYDAKAEERERLEAQEFDEQVAAIAAGTNKIADFIGPKPSQTGKPDEYKTWNAKRMALDRAAKKQRK